MRAILLLVVTAVWFFPSCKKNKQDDVLKGVSLSKVFEDGKLLTSYSYNSKNQVEKEENFEADGSLDYAAYFSYNSEGLLTEEKYTNSAGKFISKAMYSWNKKQVVSQEFMSLSGGDSGKITIRNLYDSGPAGMIMSIRAFDPQSGEQFTSRQLEYYSNGNLKRTEVYFHNPQKVLQWQVNYNPGGDTAHHALLNFKLMPIDFRLYDLSVPVKTYKTFNALGVVVKETKTTYEKRLYNSKGLLMQQIATEQSVIPPGLPEVKKYQYEYVEF